MKASRRYPRGTDEFTRVLAFSDALFAIAVTLIVVAIGVPRLQDGDDPGELLRALGDLTPEMVSFVVSFVVIGRYWYAHHDFFSRLEAVDRRLIATNLVYLAFVAFLPFPTAVLGDYFYNPVSITMYAIIVAAISGLEVVMFVQAQRSGLLEHRLPPDVFHWGLQASLAPVLFFVISVPVAFVSTTVAVLLWFGVIPLEMVVHRRKPAAADDYLG